jgi:hypothetical protein
MDDATSLTDDVWAQRIVEIVKDGIEGRRRVDLVFNHGRSASGVLGCLVLQCPNLRGLLGVAPADAIGYRKAASRGQQQNGACDGAITTE